MSLKMYDFECPDCGARYPDELVEEGDTLTCLLCFVDCKRLPAAATIAMSASQRDASLKARSAADNEKHHQDRVVNSLDRVDRGVGRGGSVFDPKYQASQSKPKKR
jgi:hypothetical protein